MVALSTIKIRVRLQGINYHGSTVGYEPSWQPCSFMAALQAILSHQAIFLHQPSSNEGYIIHSTLHLLALCAISLNMYLRTVSCRTRNITLCAILSSNRLKPRGNTKPCSFMDMFIYFYLFIYSFFFFFFLIDHQLLLH